MNEIEKDSWVTEALGHDPGEKTIESRVEPTCERSGSYREIIRCKRCDTILENTKINIDPNGHTLVEVQGTPPTCVGSGTADHWKCTVCGDTFSDKRAEDNPSEYRFNPYLKPLGHEIEYHEAKAPTCTEDGNKEHWLCTRCNIAFINESLSAGYNASDMVIKATGHQWDENFTIDKEPSCTEEGSKSKHCSACEATKDVTAIEKTPHAYGPWATTEEPSCTEPGSREKICADCEDKVLEEIPAKGHQWDEDFTIDKQPSCTEEGSKSKHCSACEATKDVTAIEAPGHDYEDIIVPPTCTEGGYTLHTCSRCSDSFKDSEVEAAGHAWGDWETIDAARCEAEGLKQRECAVCHVKEQNIEDALGHDFAEEFTVDQKATVGADGSMSRHCSRCDAVAESTVIPAIEDNIYFADGEFTYNGSEQKPEVSVKDVNGDAIDEANYAVSYENNINAGTAKAIVAFDSEAYEGTLQREFMINKADPVIVADKEIKVRVKKTKQIVLTDEDLGDVTFTSAKKKIATVTSAGVVKGKKIGTTTITVTATGSGNYNPGEVTIDVIVPKIIKKAALSKTTFTYNGQVQMPKIKTVNKSKKLKEGEAFEVVWPEEPVKAGKYKVTIKGIGKYDGSVTKTYKIVKAPQKISVTVPSVKVGETAQLQPEAIGSGAYTYASAARKIATVDANGVITGKKAGTVKITITKAADENYKKAVKTIKVKVVK
ncbi:MAG: Ig-like domain-containing protein [Bacillota bacterium]|nr:Ig-like domain-containing protein [Bacillota bacterium]